jgi:hypothetical protein
MSHPFARYLICPDRQQPSSYRCSLPSKANATCLSMLPWQAKTLTTTASNATCLPVLPWQATT